MTCTTIDVRVTAIASLGGVLGNRADAIVRKFVKPAMVEAEAELVEA